jgi:methyl-accepting chemotaxis protein
VSTNKPNGFGPWRLLLPLALGAAAIAALLHVQQFSADQSLMRAQLRASEQLAVRLAVAGVHARYGTRQGFEGLAAVRATLVALRKQLRELPPPQRLAPAPIDTAALLGAWEKVQIAIEQVRDVAPQVESLAQDAERLQSVATGLLVNSDELVESLIKVEAKPSQLRAAARQLMLVQRIGTNVRRLLQPDAGLLAAADRLGRDAVVFGEVATALMHGNPALGIARVEDDEPRDILATVGREFRVLAQAVETVMAGGAAHATLAVRADRLSAATLALDVHHTMLRQVFEARPSERLLRPVHVLQLMGLAVFSLFAALLFAIFNRRRQARVSDHVREQHDLAVNDLHNARDALSAQLEQLASDIHRIADGDVGLRAHTSGAEDPAVAVARAGLDRLRQQLSRYTEDGTRLAQSGQLVGEVAQRLRETVRRHSQQTESAGQATRVMASALEHLRLESTRVSDAARDSGVSAQRASGALGETLHELDAVRAGVEECASRVRALEDVARELRAVRTLVEDVGELGKMLSLNVAIQASVDSAASRALSAFSDEVQRLAARARSAVIQVEAIHVELRDEAERAASAVKESVWRARSAAERARGARASVDELSGAARRLDDLNQALAKSQREHAVNVTEVVRTMTVLHSLTSEVRESVDATADSARTFADAAARVEYRLAGPNANEESVLELAVHGAAVAASDDPNSVESDDDEDSRSVVQEPTVLSQSNKRWR